MARLWMDIQSPRTCLLHKWKLYDVSDGDRSFWKEFVGLNHQELNKRSLVITFDDGFDSNKKFAWRFVEKLAFPSDTFLVTGCIGQRNRWDGPSRENYPLLSLSGYSDC